MLGEHAIGPGLGAAVVKAVRDIRMYIHHWQLLRFIRMRIVAEMCDPIVNLDYSVEPRNN
jgi:hypothetical protein